MEQSSSSSNSSSCRLSILFSTTIILAFFTLLCFPGSVESYKNYTVGDTLGWYDALEKPTVNYQKWVVGKDFSLGDFLLFNTDNNHSVIQTYNITTYRRCDYEDSLDNDTLQWSSADPSAISPHPVTVAVPLVKVGMTYFFSSDYDGEQCQNGQHFKVNVTFGQGLPKSLQGDGSPAPAASPDAGGNDEESVPDTLVPSNFNNPKPEESSDSDGEDEASGSASLSLSMNLFIRQITVTLMLFGLICTL